jgi:hypothetical protein
MTFFVTFLSHSRDIRLFLKLKATRANEYSTKVKIFTHINGDIFGHISSQSRDIGPFLTLKATKVNEYSNDDKFFT